MIWDVMTLVWRQCKRLSQHYSRKYLIDLTQPTKNVLCSVSSVDSDRMMTQIWRLCTKHYIFFLPPPIWPPPGPFFVKSPPARCSELCRDQIKQKIKNKIKTFRHVLRKDDVEHYLNVGLPPPQKKKKKKMLLPFWPRVYSLISQSAT